MNGNNYFNDDSTTEITMKELVNAIMDEINHHAIDALEPYEFYANKLHLKLFENPEVISSRLDKGYHSLIAEIAKDYEDKIK